MSQPIELAHRSLAIRVRVEVLLALLIVRLSSLGAASDTFFADGDFPTSLLRRLESSFLP